MKKSGLLKITVTRRPILTEITVEGAKSLMTEDIIEELELSYR